MLARRIIARTATILWPCLASLALLAVAKPALADDKKEEREEIEDRTDPNQPKATAAGVYSLATYPLREIDRTLLQPAGVVELKPEVFIDMSKGNTFKSWVLGLEAEYGLSDTFELQAGVLATAVAPDGVDKPVAVIAGVEFALAYDLIDARAAVALPLKPDFGFDIVLGLPLRIRINKNIAIVALDEILTIHTVGVETAGTVDPNNPTATTTEKEVPKPDLTIGVGGLFQVLDQLAVIVEASIVLPGFETDEKIRRVPLELDIQYTVSNMFDVGLGLSLTNFLKKSATDKIVPFDDRLLLLFARVRFGS